MDLSSNNLSSKSIQNISTNEKEWFYILILILGKKKIMSRCFSAAAGFFTQTHTHTSAKAEILLRPFEV